MNRYAVILIAGFASLCCQTGWDEYIIGNETTSSTNGTTTTTGSSTSAITAGILSSYEPTESESVCEGDITLEWDATTNITEFEYQISTLAPGDFSASPLVATSGLTDTISITGISALTTVYWRVRGTSLATTWTSTRSFNVVPADDAPSLALPSDLTVACMGGTQALSWNPATVSAGNSYEVVADTSPSFTTLNLDTTVTTTSYNASLTPDTYYWRVRTITTGCASPWSVTWQFTDASIMAIPTPISPIATVETVPDPLFTWNRVSNATQYDLEVSTDSTFVIADLADSNIPDFGSGTTQSHTASTYLANGINYWRVRAENATCTGPWAIASGSFQINDFAAPTTISPDSASLGANPILIDFDDVGGATGYEIQIGSTSGGTEELVLTAAGISQFSHSFSGTGTYYIQVRATDGSDWSVFHEETIVINP